MSCWIQFSGQCSPNNYRLRKYQVTNERCVDISARCYARIITTQQHLACTADFIVFQSCVNELEKQPHGKASRQTWPLDFCYAFVCVIIFTKPSPHYQVHHSPLQLSSGTRASLWLLDKICEWPGNEVTSWAQFTRVKHYNYRFLKLKVFFLLLWDNQPSLPVIVSSSRDNVGFWEKFSSAWTHPGCLQLLNFGGNLASIYPQLSHTHYGHIRHGINWTVTGCLGYASTRGNLNLGSCKNSNCRVLPRKFWQIIRKVWCFATSRGVLNSLKHGIHAEVWP